MSTPPPVYRDLVESMGFDPDGIIRESGFQDWNLHETYPPTVGELAGSLENSLQPKLIEGHEDD